MIVGGVQEQDVMIQEQGFKAQGHTPFHPKVCPPQETPSCSQRRKKMHNTIFFTILFSYDTFILWPIVYNSIKNSTVALPIKHSEDVCLAHANKNICLLFIFRIITKYYKSFELGFS